jgi:hypothetical protein
MRDLIFFKRFIVRNPEKVHINNLSYKLNLAKEVLNISNQMTKEVKVKVN